MNTMRLLAAATSVTACLSAAVLLAPSEAHACSCMQVSQSDGFDQSAAVFEGLVQSITPGSQGVEPTVVELRVVRTWKGAETEAVTVKTAANSAACGYGFEQGEGYLVYANEQDGGLWVSLCSRTAGIDSESAQEDIAAMGEGITPVDPTGEPPPADYDAPEPTQPTGGQDAPARGGCASCSTTGGDASGGLAIAAALVLLALRRRRA